MIWVIDILVVAIYIILLSADSFIVGVWEEVSLVQLIEHLNKVDVLMAKVVRHTLLFLVLDQDNNSLITQNWEFYSLFDQTLLAFAERHLPLVGVGNPHHFVDLALSHFQFNYRNVRMLNIIKIGDWKNRKSLMHS